MTEVPSGPINQARRGLGRYKVQEVFVAEAETEFSAKLWLIVIRPVYERPPQSAMQTEISSIRLISCLWLRRYSRVCDCGSLRCRLNMTCGAGHRTTIEAIAKRLDLRSRDTRKSMLRYLRRSCAKYKAIRHQRRERKERKRPERRTHSSHSFNGTSTRSPAHR